MTIRCNRYENSGAGALRETSDAGQNLVGRPGPDEGFRIFVVNINIFADGRLQLFHASEYATTNPLVGDFGEPALHQVDPGTVGGGEMDTKARSFGEPLPDARRFVRAVVVQDDMNIEIGGHVGLDGIQKSAEFVGTMATMHLANYAAGP
jgi:hypothetical protein